MQASDLIVIISTLILSVILLNKKIDESTIWRATAIPLASIIGSGFLVIAPLLYMSVGIYSVYAMLFLVILSYMIGGAIRYNIKEIEPRIENDTLSNGVLFLERVSDLALAFAYIVSVTYYLSLFGDFALRGVDLVDETLSKSITTGLILFIAFYGNHRGFNFLAKFESVKLAIIGGLIAALIFGNFQAYKSGVWHLPSYKNSSLDAMFIILGMLIVVQGFETSRYLGDKFNRDIRIKSMKLAQFIAGAVYVIYIALMLYYFNYPMPKSGEDTAVITLSKHISQILPVALLALALIAQFDAAVADAQGGNGLFMEVLKKYINKVLDGVGYLIIAFFGLIIVWTSNIYEIITYASKAFAFYYFIQTLESALTAFTHKKEYLKSIYFIFVASFALSVVIFGAPAKG